MKVYFIAAGYDSCYYVRSMLPLQAGGWWGDLTTLRGIKNPSDQSVKGVMASDVVVFQRPMQLQHIEMIKMLQSAGKIVVFDNDDSYQPNTGVPRIMDHIPGMEEKVDEVLTTLDNRLKECASLADLVTVSTDFLAGEYRTVNPNVIVLPNCVCPEDWEEPLKNETDTVRILISGSTLNCGDYEQAKEAILTLSEMPNVQIVVFGLPPDRPDQAEQRAFYQPIINWWEQVVGAEWTGWVGIEDYKDVLNEMRIDICLIPRVDNYFNRCKSNLKYLEMSMFEIPTICQGFTTGDSPYQKDIIHNENGMIALTEDDWLTHTLELINNPEKRKAMGKQAKAYVVEHYDINKRIGEWETAYTSIWKKEK